jgi:hypothetical protein
VNEPQTRYLPNPDVGAKNHAGDERHLLKYRANCSHNIICQGLSESVMVKHLRFPLVKASSPLTPLSNHTFFDGAISAQWAKDKGVPSLKETSQN